MDSELLNNYGSADGINSLSKRFALKKYLQLTDEEIIMNERMLREEKGMDPNGDYRDLPKLYNPEEAEAGGFEGGLGSFSGGSGGPTAPAIDDFAGDGEDNLDDIDIDNDDSSTPDETDTEQVPPAPDNKAPPKEKDK